MSFTTKIKEEIVSKDLSETEKYSILAGFVRNNATWYEDKLQLINENNDIINYFKNILDMFKGIKYEAYTKDSNNFTKNDLHVLKIVEGSSFLLDLVAYQKEVPPDYFFDGKLETKAYLKGVFLNGGSVNDPKTSRYHMEILIDYPEEAVFVQKVLNSYNLNIKMLNRDRSYMLYLKEAEKISDFLKIVDATNSVLYYENVRIYRDKKNQTNRLNNCEQANTDRIIASALEQLNQIEVLKENNALDLLDDKTKEALYYREKYKEASLKELSEIIEKETGRSISKSGLNHRFRKIKELASKFMEQ